MAQQKRPADAVGPWCQFMHLYKPADKKIVFNENKFFPEQRQYLREIEWVLPEPPPLDKIPGWGLKPENQYFEKFRPETPAKLKELERVKKIKTNGVEILNPSPRQKLEHIESLPEYYKDEIQFILKEWDRRKNGFWFFNNGKPTYITNHHYFYLVYYDMEGRHPDFRRRCQIHFLFIEFCHLDEVCFGHNYPKMRSDGATNRIDCVRINNTTMHSSWKSGIQSKTEDDAALVHINLIRPALRKLPFFFQPVNDGNTRTTSITRYFAPDAREHPDHEVQDALNSWLSYENSGENAYDSQRMNEIHSDECGKYQEGSAYVRMMVQRKTLLDNGKKRGEIYNTSTVNEMTAKGGMEFKEICDHSHYHQPNSKDFNGKQIAGRDTTGRTISWLYNLFIPSYEGYMMYDKDGKCSVDKYGDTDYKMTVPYLVNYITGLRESGNTVAWIEETRQTPLVWNDCWKMSSKDCQFNLAILETRIEQLKFDGNPIKRAINLEWEKDFGGPVIMKDAPDNGRWLTSYEFDHWEKEANLRTNISGVWYPANTRKFVAGADPYKYKLKRDANNKQANPSSSKGGIAVFMKWDPMLDPEGMEVSKRKTDRFVMTYSHRHRDRKKYFEDVLKTCIYYGCEVFPETNVDGLVEYFINNGFGGYLFYKTDQMGYLNAEPGSDTYAKMQDDIFAVTDKYIDRRGLYEYHDEYLEQCKFIQGDMGPFDLFVACGYCLIAATQYEYRKQTDGPKDLSSFYKFYSVDKN